MIELRNLDIGYERPLQRGINATIRPGEIILVSGPNGCGKSTFINTLKGSIPPLSGEVELTISPIKFNILPQSPTFELPLSITIREILDCYNFEIEWFRFLEQSFFEKKWQDASGGEKQKTLILSRLAQKSDILILDEPFNHLDARSIKDISEFLCKIVAEKFVKSLIIISHIKPNFEKHMNFAELKFQ